MALWIVLAVLAFASFSSAITDLDVDGKPFGYGNTVPIAEVEGFPSVKEFFISEYTVNPG